MDVTERKRGDRRRLTRLIANESDAIQRTPIVMAASDSAGRSGCAGSRGWANGTIRGGPTKR